MRITESHVPLLVFTVIATFQLIRVSANATCNPAVLKLYGWCEQWACADNCTCVERPDCRQYCDGQTCKDMRCLSPSVCKQKVHLNGKIRPHVLNMFARAPFVTQDCTGGTCDVMRAKMPKKNRNSKKNRARGGKRRKGGRSARDLSSDDEASNAALQNCVDGRCRRLISTLKISKQFCSHCTKIHCFGVHATNCTQICAIGQCNHVQCDADDCQQACLQNSTCKLKCGKNVKTCLQVCEEGSNCDMICNAEKCKQICTHKGCRIIKSAQNYQAVSTMTPTAMEAKNDSVHPHEHNSMKQTNFTLHRTTPTTLKAKTTTTTTTIREFKTTATTTEEYTPTATTPTSVAKTRLLESLTEVFSSKIDNNIDEIKTTFLNMNNSAEGSPPANPSLQNSSNGSSFFTPQLWVVTLGCIIASFLI